MSVQPPPYSEFDNKPSLKDVTYPPQNQFVYNSTAQSSYPIVMAQGPPVTVTVMQQFREVPCRIVCQFCNKEGITKMKYKSGTMSWVSCLFISFILPLGCCFLPFCIKSCKDPVHYCPHCDKIVGRYNRM